MNVGISIDKLYSGKIGGAEQYIRNVIEVFSKTKGIKTILFLNDSAMDSFKEQESETICRICVPEQMKNVNKFYEYFIAKFDIQVLFCPLFYVPYEGCSVPVVASILDIQHEFFPENFSEELLAYRRTETRKTLKESSAIITISEYSKKTIVEKLGVSRKKIYVTYLNSDRSFDIVLNEDRKYKIRMQLPERYIFYPANSWPHKNHKRLIDALEILKKKYHSDCKLVLTGNAFDKENELREYIASKGLSNEVVSLGYIRQKEMPYVFANAEILVFPSLFEGFGIPLVEAMRVGTPIACSECGSVPEIAGDAAVLFDAYDAEDIAAKLNILEKDGELRERLTAQGKIRAKDFSWEKCAQETMKVLTTQCKKRCIRNRKAAILPTVLLILPAFRIDENLQKTLESLAVQEYSHKKIIILCKNRDMVRQMKIMTARYPKLIEVHVQKYLRFLLKKNRKRNIFGIVQSGHIFGDKEEIEKLVLHFISCESKILIIRPRKKGFWGSLLKSDWVKPTYQKYVDYDKIANSLFFIASEHVKILQQIHYWFYGHYQEEIFCVALEQNVNLQYCFRDSIEVLGNLNIERGEEYVDSLKNIERRIKYIPPFIVNEIENEQVSLMNELSNQIYDVKQYYMQIENCRIEFEGICSDGWMSRKCEMEVEVSGTGNVFKLKGENAELTEETMLQVSLDNIIFACKRMERFGKFYIEAELPEGVKEGKHIIRLEMNKVFSAYEKNQDDIRALSVRILEVSLNNIRII